MTELQTSHLIKGHTLIHEHFERGARKTCHLCGRSYFSVSRLIRVCKHCREESELIAFESGRCAMILCGSQCA